MSAMNLEDVRALVGKLIQLRPEAVRLDERGRELDRRDDLYMIEENPSKRGMRLFNLRTRHLVSLNVSDVSGYELSESWPGRGVLRLRRQLCLQGRSAWFEAGV